MKTGRIGPWTLATLQLGTVPEALERWYQQASDMELIYFQEK